MTSSPTRRTLLGAMAITSVAAAIPVAAAISSSPDGAFKRALRNYQRHRDADRYDAKSGHLRAAYDLYDQRVATFEAKYGTKDKAAVRSEDRETWDRYYDEMRAAEELHCDTFSTPRWDAFEVFAATASPTIAALHLKVETAMDEDGNLDGILGHIRNDIRRLASQSTGERA